MELPHHSTLYVDQPRELHARCSPANWQAMPHSLRRRFAKLVQRCRDSSAGPRLCSDNALSEKLATEVSTLLALAGNELDAASGSSLGQLDVAAAPLPQREGAMVQPGRPEPSDVVVVGDVVANELSVDRERRPSRNFGVAQWKSLCQGQGLAAISSSDRHMMLASARPRIRSSPPASPCPPARRAGPPSPVPAAHYARSARGWPTSCRAACYRCGSEGCGDPG